MTDDSWIAPALAANPSAPDDLLLALIGTQDVQTQSALLRRHRYSQSRYRPLSPPVANALARSPHVGVRVALANCVRVPDEALVTLAGDPERRVRLAVVVRPIDVSPRPGRYAPDEVYAMLVRDESAVVRRELLDNPEVPDHITRELAWDPRLRDEVQLRVGDDDAAAAAYRRMLSDPEPDPSSHVRYTALCSRRFRPPADLVARLLADARIRLTAIGCVPLTPELARSLVADEDPEVRRAVARNPDLTDDLLRVLAEDPDKEVRLGLIHRPYVPVEVLDSIAYELDPTTRTHGVAWLWEQRHDTELVTRYAGSRQVVYRRTVAAIADLAPELVQRLAYDEDDAVRLILAENNGDRVPVELLAAMVLTWRGFSAMNLVRNPRVPADVIDQLARSEDLNDRCLAYISGRLTDEHRALLADDPSPKLSAAVNPPPTLDEFVERLADPDPEVRAQAASHRDLPVELMWRLWRRASA